MAQEPVPGDGPSGTPGRPEKLPTTLESGGVEAGGGGLELFHLLSRDQGAYPVRRAFGTVSGAPLLWCLPMLASLGYHLAVGWLVGLGVVARSTVFPTLVVPLSQAFHAGLVVLAVGVALDALRSSGPQRASLAIRRTLRPAALGAVLFLGLRLGLDASLGTLLPGLFGGLSGLFLLLWLWLHVASELVLAESPGPSALPRGLARALTRLLHLPAALADGTGRARLAAGLAPLGAYLVMGIVPFVLSRSFDGGIATMLLILGFTGMGLAGAVHVVAWAHIELAARLREAGHRELPDGPHPEAARALEGRL